MKLMMTIVYQRKGIAKGGNGKKLFFSVSASLGGIKTFTDYSEILLFSFVVFICIVHAHVPFSHKFPVKPFLTLIQFNSQ